MNKNHSGQTNKLRRFLRLATLALLGQWLAPLPASANPYLAKPGESPKPR